jgi:DNA modification methylase
MNPVVFEYIIARPLQEPPHATGNTQGMQSLQGGTIQNASPHRLSCCWKRSRIFMDKDLEISVVSVKDLHLDPSNARTGHDLEQLQASIEEFGFADPIEAQRGTGRIIAGNGRYQAAKALGLNEVPVIWHDMDDLEATRYGLANNQLTDNSEWDLDVLPDLLNEVGLDVPGFDTFELPEVNGPIQEDEPQVDRAEELREKWQIEEGQLWQVGRHRLMCGDSTRADHVEAVFDGAEPFLTVTDPPYGVEYDPHRREVVGGKRATKVSKIIKNDNNADWREAFSLSPSGVVYCWHADKYACVVYQSLMDTGFSVRTQIIWAKSSIVPVPYGINPGQVADLGLYHYQHECCWYGVKGKAKWIGGKAESTLWEIEKNANSETGHSTQKPVECMTRAIRNHEGDVYDPFLGSGTTMVAAEQLDRVCYGMEIDPGYCAVILERMSQYTEDIKPIKTNWSAIGASQSS